MTQKTKAELDALFPDNTNGLITPARLRDFVDTSAHSHGSMYITTPQATAITTPGTFVKMAGITTAVGDAHRASMPADNRLQYDGTAQIHAHIVVNISAACGSNNQTLSFAIYKNGAPLTHSIMDHRIGTGADVVSIAIHADALMAAGDYLELWCTNNTSTASITAQKAYMFFMGMFQ